MYSNTFSINLVVASAGLAYSSGLMVCGQPIVALEIDNSVGGSALSVWKIQAQDAEGGEWYDYLTTTDFAAGAANNLLFVSANPASLAQGSRAHVHFRTNGVRNIRFVAQCAGTGGTTTVRGSKIDL